MVCSLERVKGATAASASGKNPPSAPLDLAGGDGLGFGVADSSPLSFAEAIPSAGTAVAEELNGNPANCEEKKENTWPE